VLFREAKRIELEAGLADFVLVQPFSVGLEGRGLDANPNFYPFPTPAEGPDNLSAMVSWDELATSPSPQPQIESSSSPVPSAGKLEGAQKVMLRRATSTGAKIDEVLDEVPAAVKDEFLEVTDDALRRF
jgi:hypothetical protein